MDSAIAGLSGAGIGALAGMTGTIIAQTLQSRREHQKWLLTRKEDAYSNSLRHLLRVLNRRSILTADGLAILGKDEVPEWFTDITEAQAALTSLMIYCAPDVRQTVKQVATKYNAAISMLMGHRVDIAADSPAETVPDRVSTTTSMGTFVETVSYAYLEILKCAEKDLGDHVA